MPDLIRNPKYRPDPPGFLVKPGMTRFFTPDSRNYDVSCRT